MHCKNIFQLCISIPILACLLFTSCDPNLTSLPESSSDTPEWFDIEMNDVRTGETFKMNDFAGKVVLVETMAMWCAPCVVQAGEVQKLYKLLGDSEELVSVSLDIDLNEEESALKDYVEEHGFEWRFAIAPIEVARALGNLYGAQFLNPPVSAMLVIDRNGKAYPLEFGKKSAEVLLETLRPYLEP